MFKTTYQQRLHLALGIEVLHTIPKQGCVSYLKARIAAGTFGSDPPIPREDGTKLPT